MAKKKKTPEMPKDQKAKLDQRQHYASQASKKDAAYDGDTLNTAIYGPASFSKK